MEVENEEYILGLGDPVIGQASSSSSQDAEGEESKDEKPVLKTKSLDFEGKDFLKDLIQCVKTENQICDPQTNCSKDNSGNKDILKDVIKQVNSENKVCHLRANFIKEEPFDKNDASFIAELKKLAHDVEDSKSENWHHPSLIKLEPVEITSQHKQTVELCNKPEFCFKSALANYGSSNLTIEKNQAVKGNNTPREGMNSYTKKNNQSSNATTNLSFKIIDMTRSTKENNLDSSINKREHTTLNSKGIGKRHAEKLAGSHKRSLTTSLTQKKQFTKNTTNFCPSVKTYKTSNQKEFHQANPTSRCAPVNVEEKPLCKTLSNKLHSYKQIEKGQQICEMLFSHIPVADNSATEEIYVSKVSEINATPKTQNTISNADKTLLDVTEGEQEITDLSTNSSQQPKILEATKNEHLQSSRSCSQPEKNSRLSQSSSSGLLLEKSSTITRVNLETPNPMENTLSQSLECARKAKEQSVTGKFKCRYCDKVYDDKRSLNKHLFTHGKRKFVCSDCGKAYFQKAALDEHNKLEHSGKQSAKFKCPECNQAFNNSQCLRRHQHNKHKSVRSTIDLLSTCDVCRKTYKSRTHMVTHRRYRHRSEAEFTCGECSMVFNNKPKLMAHVKVNHLPPTYKCEKCSALLHTMAELNSHLHRSHAVLQKKSVVCEKCRKSFKDISVLQAHVLNHSEENHFYCKECGNGFKDKMNLNQHLRSHLETRRFSCGFCKNTFKHKSHLKQHMAVHGIVPTPKYGRRGKRVAERFGGSKSSSSGTGEKP